MKNMRILSTLIFIVASFLVKAQSDKYDELVILYADEKYEKVIEQSDKLSGKEAYKKDAEPYFWMSKAFYKISLSGTMDPAYKNAYKSAVKSLAKGMKKDKDSSVTKHNIEFVEELQQSLKELVVNDLLVGDFRKAGGWAQQYLKISYNAVGAEYLVASTKYRAGDKTGAKTIFSKCDKILKSTNSIENWSEPDRVLLKAGVLQSAECFLESKQLDKAMELLNSVKPWFMEDEDFNEKYKEFTN